MNQDLNIIELVLHASIIVKVVIAGLLLTSLLSWGLIFSKLGSIGKIKRRNEAFEQDFWSGKSLTDLYSQASNQADTGPLERLFSSGMREFMKLRDRRLDTGAGAPLARLHQVARRQHRRCVGQLGRRHRRPQPRRHLHTGDLRRPDRELCQRSASPR